MAMDFGDEAGEALLRLFKEGFDRALNHRGNGSNPLSSAVEWFKNKFMGDGMSEEEAQAQAEKMASRDFRVIQFGTPQEASVFAQVVCGENNNDTFCEALTDKDGKGYIRFFAEDMEQVQRHLPEYSQIIGEIKLEQEISPDWKNTVPAASLEGLKPVPAVDISKYMAHTPDAATRVSNIAAPVAGAAAVGAATAAKDGLNKTEAIAEAAREAQGKCRDFNEFRELLAEKGIGITETVAGENMLYEARLNEKGELLPYDHDQRDWAVSADKLREHGVDVSKEWFDKNTPRETPEIERGMTDKEIAEAVRSDLETDGIPTYDSEKYEFCVDRNDVIECDRACEVYDKTRDELNIGVTDHGGHDEQVNEVEQEIADGSLDMDGRTPDLNQGIESHDGRDTNTNTFRMEYEATGSGDVPPSKVRDTSMDKYGRTYDLSKTQREVRSESQHLAQERGSSDRVADISDKFSQTR